MNLKDHAGPIIFIVLGGVLVSSGFLYGMMEGQKVGFVDGKKAGIEEASAEFKVILEEEFGVEFTKPEDAAEPTSGTDVEPEEVKPERKVLRPEEGIKKGLLKPEY